MTETKTIGDLARELSEAFTDGPRVSDDTQRQIRTLRDGAPEWMHDLVREAHGDMLPDDWRYEMIEAAAEALADADGDEDEAREALEHNVPIYTVKLSRWLGSHGARAGYCDEAADEYGTVRGIMNLIQLGYLTEAREVFEAVLTSLRERAEAEAEAED